MPLFCKYSFFARPIFQASDSPQTQMPELARTESRSESWRTRSEWRPEWGTESVHHRVILSLVAALGSRSELASAIGHRSISNALRQALADLMGAGLVEYTIHEKPNSRLQRYRLTSKASPKSI